MCRVSSTCCQFSYLCGCASLPSRVVPVVAIHRVVVLVPFRKRCIVVSHWYLSRQINLKLSVTTEKFSSHGWRYHVLRHNLLGELLPVTRTTSLNFIERNSFFTRSRDAMGTSVLRSSCRVTTRASPHRWHSAFKRLDNNPKPIARTAYFASATLQ
jgi:hypothetical protein